MEASYARISYILLDSAYRLATGGGAVPSGQQPEQDLQQGKTEDAHAGQRNALRMPLLFTGYLFIPSKP